MNKIDALEKLRETRQLDTTMLKPLGITFEQFLRLGQFDKERYERSIDRFIRREDSKIKAKMQEAAAKRKETGNE